MLTFTLRYAGDPYFVNATNSPITNQVITIVARERCYISVEERADRKHRTKVQESVNGNVAETC